MTISMKTVAMAALAVSLAPIAVQAAPSKTATKPPIKAKVGAPQTNPQANPLGLSKTQIQKLDAIKAKAQAEAAVVRNGKGTDEEKRTKLIAIAKRADAQAGTILTPAQKNKIKKFQTDRVAAIKRAQANDKAVMATLTPDQKKKLEVIRTDFMKQFTALKNDPKLTDQQKQQKAQGLYITMDAKVKALLTPKQKAMLQKR